jgi:outer membrane protein TolC
MRVFCLILSLIVSLSIYSQEKNLQYYIDQSLRNNPQLNEYRNQIGIKKLDSLRIRAENGFQVSAVSNDYYAPVINDWGYDEVKTDLANVSAQLSVTRQITGTSNLNNQFRLLDIENRQLVNSIRVSEQDLIKNVTQQYISAYGSWQTYLYHSEIAGLLHQEEIIIKRLTEQSTYSQNEYLSFLITLRQQESNKMEAYGQFRSDLSSLIYLCGIHDTALTMIPEPILKNETPPEAVNSVFYQSFINDSLKLSVEDRQIDFSYRPKLSLFGDAGYYSSLMFEPWKNFGASAGISFSMPVYDGKQRKMQHNKIYIEEQTRQQYRSYFVNQYNQQLFQLNEQIRNNLKLADLLEQQVVYSKALMDADHELLEKSGIRITDYILAINNYLEIRQAVVKNKIERYLLINQLNYWSRTK